MEVLGWIFLALIAFVILVAVGTTIVAAGDMKRYVRMKRM